MSKIEFNSLLGSSFRCECGKVHVIPTKYLFYEEEAIERVSEILSREVSGREIGLLADVRTYEIAGRQTERQLRTSNFSVQIVIVPDMASGGMPVCDDKTQAFVANEFKAVDAIVAVGSGVINDLAKWTAFERDIPYMCVATAASMNGYTAANVASIVKGLKTIVYARAPIAVVAKPKIIENAPYEMTASGLGDVLAKPVSTADWIMNHFLFDEYFCERCTQLISEIEPKYFNCPEDVRARKPEAIKALYEALIYSGIAMTMAGTSAPASGGEHMLSHTLDMMWLVDGIEHDMHGRQVGLGTIFASALYEKLLAIEKPVCYESPESIDRKFWGRLADTIEQQYNLKKPHLKIIRQKLSDIDEWKQFKELIRPRVRKPADIKDCLKRASAAHRIEDIVCSRKRVLSAALHMHEIRKRCTVVDLAYVLGIMPDVAEEIIDVWMS